MRLLIVSQYFWPEDFRINAVAQDLANRGHEISVLCGTPNYPAGRTLPGFGWFRRTRERWNGVDVVRVPLIPRGSGGWWRLALNYVSYALSASVLGPIRCRGDYQVILIYQMSPATMGVPAMIMKALKRAPVLYWVQDLWPESLAATGAVRARWMLSLIDRMVRLLYRSSELVLIQSRAFRSHVELRGVPSERVRYFPNSAEPCYVPLPPEDAHPALARLPSGFRVMFAGNIGSVQDLATVLTAAELTRLRTDVQWILVGDGSMRPWVDAEVRRRGLSDTVYLLGRFPVKEMPRLFAGADALLVTLRRDPILALTIPSKIQSYLASGKPIVAALDGEGAAVINEAGAGFCAPAEDPQALAEKVLALRDLDARTRIEMGQRGRRYFLDQFRSEMLLDRFESWCSELGAPSANSAA